MKLRATRETSISLSGAGDGLELESEAVPVSPYHLLAASLATCAYLVIERWPDRRGKDPSGLGIDVGWEHAADGRVASMELALRWPGLAEEARTTVRRLAAACPVHRTLHDGTDVAVVVTTGSGTTSGRGDEG